MIVVTGAGGQLGSAFLRLLGANARGLERADLDLEDLDAVAPCIGGLSPDLVVNCASYTAVDRAEQEPLKAHAVNALAVERLAAAALASGAGFVTFSTDYVFAGDATSPYVETSPTGPLNVYGATKLEGEGRALAAHPRALVIRTSWLLSATHPNFVATMLRLTARGGARVVDDQVGRPTLVDHLAPAVLAAVKAGARGLLHLAGGGEATWCGLAKEAVALAGRDPGLITPIATAEYPTPARRPRYSVLGSERLADLGLDPLPHYREGLAEVVAGQLRRTPAAR